MNRMKVSIKPNIYLSIVLAAILLLPINTWAAQTVHIRLQINGNDIEGESTISSMERENTIEASAAGFNVSTPYEAASGGLTGRRIYRPFTILKRLDKSTPLLFKALAMNEPVTRLEAMFFRPAAGSSGAEEKFFTILLENARIVSIVQTSEDAIVGGQNAPPVMELISFVFQDITMTYEIGGATHKDSWRGE